VAIGSRWAEAICKAVGGVNAFVESTALPRRHVADGVELPRLPESEQRYLTHEQLHRVAVASGRLRTLVFVLGYCGLRFGEAAALRVADVDVSARRIRVRRSITYVRKTGLVEVRRRTTPRAWCQCPRSSPVYWRPSSPTARAERWCSSPHAAADI
jgi:integrase